MTIRLATTVALLATTALAGCTQQTSEPLTPAPETSTAEAADTFGSATVPAAIERYYSAMAAIQAGQDSDIQKVAGGDAMNALLNLDDLYEARGIRTDGSSPSISDVQIAEQSDLAAQATACVDWSGVQIVEGPEPANRPPQRTKESYVLSKTNKGQWIVTSYEAPRTATC